MPATRRTSGDIEELKQDLDRFGYCMAEGVLDAGRLRDALRSVKHARQRGKQPSAEADEWRRAGDEWVVLIAGESGLDDVATHPLALAMARHLLGERIMLSGYTAHVIHPGNEEMDLHTDQWWLPRAAHPEESPNRPGSLTRASRTMDHRPRLVRQSIPPSSSMSCGRSATSPAPMAALAWFRAAIFPVAEPDPDRTFETVHAEVPAGSVVMWDARTWHGSGQNSSAMSRIGVSITYCGPQFRQLQNHTLAVRPETHASLDETMRTLLGFRLFSSYGATDDDEATFARPGYERP